MCVCVYFVYVVRFCLTSPLGSAQVEGANKLSFICYLDAWEQSILKEESAN